MYIYKYEGISSNQVKFTKKVCKIKASSYVLFNTIICSLFKHDD